MPVPVRVMNKAVTLLATVTLPVRGGSCVPRLEDEAPQAVCL